MKRLPHIFGCALAGIAACTATPQVVPSRDFDRPTDMAFVCVGIPVPTAGDGGDDGGAAAGPMQVLGQPMSRCHPSDSTTTDPVDDQHRTFAFVVNSDSGSLSVLDMDHNKLVDLDPTTAGYNTAPLGLLPEQIVASDDGCRLLTPNQGSGDFSFIDPAVLLTPTMAIQQKVDLSVAQEAAPPSTFAQTIMATTQSGAALGATPGEAQFLPTTDAADCSRSKTYQTMVTFPSCNLIALVEFPSGTILDSVSVNAADGTVTPQGPNPTCSSDCAPAAGDGGAPDGSGGASDGGGAPSRCAQPTGIAIRPDGQRAYVGLADAPFITVIDLSIAGHLTGATPIVLHEGARGSDRIRLSVDPFLFVNGSSNTPSFVGEDVSQERRYLYVAARDGTLRIVQVANPFLERECETNIDPTNLPAGFDENTACQPVDPTHRRATAIGPGISLPSPVRDVAAIDLNRVETIPLETELHGDYAFVMTQNGNVYIVNIAPTPRPYGGVVAGVGSMTVNGAGGFTEGQPPAPPVTAATLYLNTLRDVNVISFSRTLDSTTGPPRLDVPPVSTSLGPRPQNFWAVNTTDNGTALPTSCGSTSDGGTTCTQLETQVWFPDATAVNPQSWAVTWQGALSGIRFSGQIAPPPSPSDSYQLIDRGVDFCAIGAQPGDLLTLSGCVTDQQCGAGKVCVHGTAAPQAAGNLPVNGICLDMDSATQATQSMACQGFLNTIKRYDIVNLTSTTGSRYLDAIELRPHLDQLIRHDKCTVSSSDGGTSGPSDGGAADGGAADGGATDGGAGDGAADASDAGALPNDECNDPSDPGARFTCVAGHCLMPCMVDTDCRPGRICEVSPGQLGGATLPGAKYCADAPAVIPQDCFDQLTAYQVNAGGSFLVTGSVTSYPVQQVSSNPPQKNVCVPVNRDPFTPNRLIRRIDVVNTPFCAPEIIAKADAVPVPAGQTPHSISEINGDRDPSIASATDAATEIPDLAGKLLALVQQMPNPNPCFFVAGPNDNGTAPHHLAALFRNTELAFMLTNLEQTPSGSLEIDFAVHGGFRAQTVIVPADVEVDLPSRIVMSPIDTSVVGNRYVFVVDQRKLGRAQGGGPTRGQVLRINPTYSPTTTTGAYPVFEDFNLSNGLYPIQ
jgi:hypothetical protein